MKLLFVYGFCMDTLSSYEILFYKTVQAPQCRFYCVLIGTKLIWFVSFLFKWNFLCLWFLYGISFKENPVLYKIFHAIWVHMQSCFFPPKDLKLGSSKRNPCFGEFFGIYYLFFMLYKKSLKDYSKTQYVFDRKKYKICTLCFLMKIYGL